MPEKFTKNMFLLAIIVFLLLSFSTEATTLSPVYYTCNKNVNFTKNSAYEHNLLYSLSALPISDKGYGFYKSSAGEGDDFVISTSLCRGDLQEEACYRCLNNAIVNAQAYCPFNKEAAIYHDQCTLVYYNKFQHEYLGMIVNGEEVLSNSDPFRKTLRSLLDELIKDTASDRGDYLPLFSSGNQSTANATNITNIYALVQCIPNLSHEDCNYCLGNAMHSLFIKFGKIVGPEGRVFQPTCTLIYMRSPFFNITTLLPPQGKSSSKKNTTMLVIVTVCVVTIILIIVGLLCVFLRLRNNNEATMEDIGDPKCMVYNFTTVKRATNNFSDEAILGRGGFGTVYKGVFENGQEIAVKRRDMNASQGEPEFRNEVSLLTKLQHRNLVRLLGYSIEQGEHVVVYEFLANASLDKFIFDSSKRECLDWVARKNIITGIAKGLSYLHEDSGFTIIHCDLKPSNILLDGQLNPKIADFGSARLFNLEETHGNTNLAVGTFGYRSPEYGTYGEFSEKTDVYSFGIIMLETIIGQRNLNFRIGGNSEHLISYVWKCWQDRATARLIDPLMKNVASSLPDIRRGIHIVLLCLQDNAAGRPTASSIVKMLERSSSVLPVPSEPAYLQ